MTSKGIGPGLVLLACTTVFPAGDAETGSTAGRYQIALTTRTFDEPLFGDDTSGTYRFFASQDLRGKGRLTAWLDSGFPSYSASFGVEVAALPVSETATGRLNAGDFFLESLLPTRYAGASTGFYPLRGLQFHVEGERTRWHVFAAEAERFRGLPDTETVKPRIFGVGAARRVGKNRFALNLTGADDPTYLDPTAEEGFAGVISGEMFREVSPWFGIFGELLAGDRDGLGWRAGTRLRFAPAEIIASVYGFNDDLPYLDPLWRPGESGVDVSGWYLLTEFTSLTGHVTYVSDDRVDDRSDMRAELRFNWNLGSNRPSLRFGYSRDEVAIDSTSIAPGDQATDRITFGLSKSAAGSMLDLEMEHLIDSSDGRSDRSQAVMNYHRLLRKSGTLFSSALAQRDENDDVGLTAEALLEQPLVGKFRYLAGLGGAYVSRGNENSGEGVLRVGLSREVSRDGWIGRLEVRMPFSIGLERSDLVGHQVSLDLIHRYSWKELGVLRNALSPGRRANQGQGAVEGRVLFGGEGVDGLTVYLNGEPRGTTGRSGRFKIRAVPAETVTVSLDVRELDTRFSVEGGASKPVTVLAGGTSGVEFRLQETSYFQGSVVTCDGGEIRPVGGVELVLSGPSGRWTETTSRMGGFQFDELPPGVYDLKLPGAAPSRRVDLSGDLTGYLIELDCP